MQKQKLTALLVMSSLQMHVAMATSCSQAPVPYLKCEIGRPQSFLAGADSSGKPEGLVSLELLVSPSAHEFRVAWNC